MYYVDTIPNVSNWRDAINYYVIVGTFVAYSSCAYGIRALIKRNEKNREESAHHEKGER
jgi:hypothetical protein